MKKRRIIAAVLAAAMLSSSVSFNVFADDTAVVDVDTAITDEVVSPAADTVSSGSSSDETPAEDNGSLSAYTEANWVGGMYTNVDNVNGEWKASVFGDCGGIDKVTGSTIYTSGDEKIPYFVAQENGEGDDKSVDLRMGIMNPDGTSDAEQVGKMSVGSDGMVYYYTELDPSDNFELSADIKINGLGTQVKDFKQASFGAMVRDEVIPMADAELYAQYVALVEEIAVTPRGAKRTE
ncbi:MAG: hypothetical protein IJR59_01090, partial [Firmicutes bacterium]|nr:hypothetical protein [Bacillota bacterium]